jgi:hypothetical protein
MTYAGSIEMLGDSFDGNRLVQGAERVRLVVSIGMT